MTWTNGKKTYFAAAGTMVFALLCGLCMPGAGQPAALHCAVIPDPRITDPPKPPTIQEPVIPKRPKLFYRAWAPPTRRIVPA